MNEMDRIEQSILEDLHALGDPMLRYSYLIECGYGLEPMEPGLKTDENLVRECEVRTWFALTENPEGSKHFHADSESLIVRGALALIAEVLDSSPSEEWAAHTWKLLDDPVFARNFTPAQSSGLSSVLSRL